MVLSFVILILLYLLVFLAVPVEDVHGILWIGTEARTSITAPLKPCSSGQSFCASRSGSCCGPATTSTAISQRPSWWLWRLPSSSKDPSLARAPSATATPQAIDDRNSIFPMMFTLVVYGTTSGFHGLVSTGIASKQLSKMRDSRVIGYSGMMGDPRSRHWSSFWSVFRGHGPRSTRQTAGGVFLEELGLEPRPARTTMNVLVVNCAGTTLDSGMRIQCILVGELGKTAQQVAPPVHRVSQNMIFQIVVSAVPSIYIANLRSIDAGWNLFGATDQLTACVSMLVVACVLRFRNNDIEYALPLVVPIAWLLVVSPWASKFPLRLLAGGEVVQEADARFAASFGRGQRRIVGVDRARDPLSCLFVSRSDRGGQLDVVGYLLSRCRWPPLHLLCELGCPRHYGNLVLSSAAPPGASLRDALVTWWAGKRGAMGLTVGMDVSLLGRRWLSAGRDRNQVHVSQGWRVFRDGRHQCHSVTTSRPVPQAAMSTSSSTLPLLLLTWTFLLVHTPRGRSSWSIAGATAASFQIAVEKPSGEGRDSLGSATQPSHRGRVDFSQENYYLADHWLSFFMNTCLTVGHRFQHERNSEDRFAKVRRTRCGDRGGFRGLGPVARHGPEPPPRGAVRMQALKTPIPVSPRVDGVERLTKSVRLLRISSRPRCERHRARVSSWTMNAAACQLVCQSHSQSRKSTFGYWAWSSVKQIRVPDHMSLNRLPVRHFSGVSVFFLRYVFWFRIHNPWYDFRQCVRRASTPAKICSRGWKKGQCKTQCWWEPANSDCPFKALQKCASDEKIALHFWCVQSLDLLVLEKSGMLDKGWNVTCAGMKTTCVLPPFFWIRCMSVELGWVIAMLLCASWFYREFKSRCCSSRQEGDDKGTAKKGCVLLLLGCCTYTEVFQNVTWLSCSVWSEHFSNSLTHFEGLRVLPVFGCSASFRENPQRPKGLKWDVGAVPCDRFRVFNLFTDHALACWSLSVAPTLQSSSSPGYTRDCTRTSSREHVYLKKPSKKRHILRRGRHGLRSASASFCVGS